jgi:hypothetical protein
MRIFLSMIVLLFATTSAQAYIGPGLGVGVIASVLSVFAGIGLLIFGAIYYPLKKLFKGFSIRTTRSDSQASKSVEK